MLILSPSRGKNGMGVTSGLARACYYPAPLDSAAYQVHSRPPQSEHLHGRTAAGTIKKNQKLPASVSTTKTEDKGCGRQEAVSRRSESTGTKRFALAAGMRSLQFSTTGDGQVPTCWITPLAAYWPNPGRSRTRVYLQASSRVGAFDVRTKSGHKVEVKSAAYAQSWPQCKPSKISFDIASRSESWDPETNTYCRFNSPKRIANVYVFCLLGQPDDPCPDPIDLDQWEFYVLAKETLDQERRSQKTIALNPLKSLVQQATGRCTTPYGELPRVIEMLGRSSQCDIADQTLG